MNLLRGCGLASRTSAKHIRSVLQQNTTLTTKRRIATISHVQVLNQVNPTTYSGRQTPGCRDPSSTYRACSCKNSKKKGRTKRGKLVCMYIRTTCNAYICSMTYFLDKNTNTRGRWPRPLQHSLGSIYDTNIQSSDKQAVGAKNVLTREMYAHVHAAALRRSRAPRPKDSVGRERRSPPLQTFLRVVPATCVQRGLPSSGKSRCINAAQCKKGKEGKLLL